MMPQTRSKSLLINLSISLASVFLCIFFIGGLELIAGIWENNLQQSEFGWELVGSRRIEVIPSENPNINAVLRPNKDYFWEGIPVHINSKGLRGEDYGFAKGENVYRILSLGDSVAFGWEVPEEEIYAKQLEKLLHSTQTNLNYEVINAGIMGWDLPIELAYLEETGFNYEPDLIIVELTVENDIIHTVYSIPPVSVASWLRDNTYTWGFLSNLRRQIKKIRTPIDKNPDASGEPSYPFPLDNADPIWTEYLYKPILEMANLSQEHNVDFMVIIFPTDSQVRSVDYPTIAQDLANKRSFR